MYISKIIFIISLLTIPSFGINFEIGPSARYISPDILNDAARLNNSDSSFSELKRQDLFKYQTDIKANLWLQEQGNLRFGLYGNYSLPNSAVQIGVTRQNSKQVIKTSEVSSYSGGLTVRSPTFKASSNLEISIEGFAGMGTVNFNQTIERFASTSAASAEESSKLTAGSSLSEGGGAINFSLPLANKSLINLKIGYIVEKSKILAVKSATGSHFDGISKDDGLYIADFDNNGIVQEFTVERTGPFVSLSYEF